MTVALPHPGWRERLSDWANEVPPRPTTLPAYEFSVGKYTPTGERARMWKILRISVEDYSEAAEKQKVAPVLVMKSVTGKRWWWYLGRFFREDEQLIASQVHRRVLELDRRKQEEIERARRKAAERVDESLDRRLRVRLAKRVEREQPPDGDHDGLQAEAQAAAAETSRESSGADSPSDPARRRARAG